MPFLNCVTDIILVFLFRSRDIQTEALDWQWIVLDYARRNYFD